MADIFSNLYLAISVENYHKNYAASKKLTDYVVNKLIDNNKKLINEVISNLGVERFLLLHMMKTPNEKDYKQELEIFDEIMNNRKVLDEIKKNIYIKNNVLSDLEKATSGIIDKNSLQYNDLKNRIINVGEFENIKNYKKT